jgi:hypothetical protein
MANGKPNELATAADSVRHALHAITPGTRVEDLTTIELGEIATSLTVLDGVVNAELNHRAHAGQDES